jgi:transcriptional regulator with XRE-family HTH domain
MTVKDEFSKRLRTAMKAAGLKPSGTELERAFSLQWRGTPISLQTATNWINGKHLPRQDRLRVIARVLRMDPHVLMYGPLDSMTAEEGRGPWKDHATQAERQAIDTFLSLPASQRLVVRDVINALALANGTTPSGTK